MKNKEIKFEDVFNEDKKKAVANMIQKRKQLIELGFKEIPHFIITRSLIYDLGRHRQLSFGDIGTPNEMLFLSEMNEEDNRKIDELICLRNYDYDGYTTVEEVEQLINLLKCKKKVG